MSASPVAPPRHRRPPVTPRQQLPLLVALVLLWMLLWDDLSWGNLLAGAALAVGVTRLFYLPPVQLAGRFHPHWALVFAGHFAVDLVRASWQVAAAALRPGYVPQSAVIALDLRTSSDLVMTLTGQALTLIPGSLIVEVDRRNTTLYVHVLEAATEEDIEQNRRAILRIEERLIRAFGSREDRAAVEARSHTTGRGDR